MPNLHQVAIFALVVAAALIASTLSGTTGFGGAVIMLPVLVSVYGPRDAVVILTITQAVGNGSRALFSWKQIDWAVLIRFIAGAIPAAILGSILFVQIPPGILTKMLGAFLLASVFYRHVSRRRPRMVLNAFLPLGIAFGFLSAVLGSVGPFVAPWFLAYGLVKGAYVSTEAVGALVMHVTKIISYGGLRIVSRSASVFGVLLSPAMIAGSYAGKWVIGRLPELWFEVLIELALVAGGILMLVR